MARRTPPTAPAPRPSGPSTRRPPTEREHTAAGPDGDADPDCAVDPDVDIDIDEERDAEGELHGRFRLPHRDTPIEREESERALDARDDPDGSLDDRLERLEREIDEIRERLDEDDDERLHYRDVGSRDLEYVDDQITP